MKYLFPGYHYDPWQKAVLRDKRVVLIVRQNGDGEQAWYFTDQNERIAEDDIVRWI